MKANHHVFTTLDGLRGIAALSVVLYHYSMNLGKELLPNAFFAVDFFFVLSGFVIAHAYERRLLQGLSVRQFLLIRLIRLYPLYFLGITVPFLASLLAVALRMPHPAFPHIALTYLFHLLLLPTPAAISTDSGRVFPLDGPAWSLSLEIGVNLLYAVFCAFLANRRLLGIAVASLAALGLAIVCYGSNSMGWDWESYLGGWARISWSFTAGILLYRCFDAKQPRYAASAGLCLPVLLLGVFAVTGQHTALAFFCPLVLFPLVIWVGAGISLQRFAGIVAQWLGKVSYAVYITHYVTYSVLSYLCFIAGIDPMQHVRVNSLVFTAIALDLAWILDMQYDTRIRARLSRLAFKRAFPRLGAKVGTHS